MKTAVGWPERADRSARHITEGDRLFREKHYKAAAEKFKAAVERGPHSPIEQDAMFMLAESYFFDDRYIKARDAYDALVKEHTEHALPRHGDRPRMGDRPLLGAIRADTIPTGR